MRVAFLDRDGTIIKDYEDEYWRHVNEPEFLSGAIDTLKQIRKIGYEIIIITNQYLIHEKIISEEKFHMVHNLFLSELESEGVNILKTYYCPHTDNENCNCKKPKTGMIDAAISDFKSIDMEKSFYVCDSLVDVELAQSMKLPVFHITDTPITGLDKYKAISSITYLLEMTNHNSLVW